MSLDPDDPRPPYQQVANALKAAILTKKFAPGERLPSGTELAKRYGVARMTVQHALGVLRDDGLIVSRQGSGVFVRERTERPIGLRPHVERAFASPHVSLDFSGFSGETLHGAIQEPLDQIRVGRVAPETISVRLLLPDTSVPMAIPSRSEDLADDPELRERARNIMTRHTQAIVDSVQELQDLGLVKSATAQVRIHRCGQLFKLYILNGEEAFFGFYPVHEHTVTVKGTPRAIYDVLGKDALLFHHTSSDDDGAIGSQYVQQARSWFESVWATIA
ncbi:MAG: GntR family transcriptional regulator, partial [Candidatus Dormibacteria bacterium]